MEIIIAEARDLCSRSECGLKTFYLFHSSFRCIVLLYSTLATTPHCTALTPPSFASFFFCLFFFFFFLNMPNCAGGWRVDGRASDLSSRSKRRFGHGQRLGGTTPGDD